MLSVEAGTSHELPSVEKVNASSLSCGRAFELSGDLNSVVQQKKAVSAKCETKMFFNKKKSLPEAISDHSRTSQSPFVRVTVRPNSAHEERRVGRSNKVDRFHLRQTLIAIASTAPYRHVPQNDTFHMRKSNLLRWYSLLGSRKSIIDFSPNRIFHHNSDKRQLQKSNTARKDSGTQDRLSSGINGNQVSSSCSPVSARVPGAKNQSVEIRFPRHV